MKAILLSLLFPAMLTACAQSGKPATDMATYASYGDSITANGALTMEEFAKATAHTDSLDTKVRAEIIGSCGKKGCWMDVKMADGSSMKVRFQDDGFFVPTSGLEGKEVVMQGHAVKAVTDVAMLRHYAQDAGKSEEEIAEITEPETNCNFTATGVLIKQ
ncbi:MAG: DUF4920 domain-containing protein [Flavobacteriales bacterium]